MAKRAKGVDNKILRKQVLNPAVKLIEVEAPRVARKFKPGQFVIVRVFDGGERIPLTLVDANHAKGSITLIFQEMGKTTKLLGQLEEGDHIANLMGPLGNPTEIKHYGRVVCIGGGVGAAEIYPVAKALKKAGNEVVTILGARNAELLILEKELGEVSDELYITTDDGSKGRKGLVVDPLKELLTGPKPLDHVFAVGPTVMMRAVANTTRPYSVKTTASLNPIMVDGTGMCGGCRVTVGKETKFACVDGPEFDAHQVDFDELMARQRVYLEEERRALSQLEASCKVKDGKG